MARKFDRPPFEATIELMKDVAVLAVNGEADMATVPKIEGAADEAFAAGVGTLVVDLSNCGFLDSTGLRFLLSARGRFTSTLVVRRPDGPVARLLELTVSGLFDTYATRAAALESVSPQLAA